MTKLSFDPGAMVNPVPVVMVSCGDIDGEKNIITIAWTGIVNSDPPMTYISVRKERHSYDMIKKSGEFVINLVTEELTEITDWCGVRSGKDYDKFSEKGLTPEHCENVACPAIKESPVSIECRVREIHEYGSHDMFVADILSVNADERIVDRNGRIRLDRAGLTAYNHGEYFGLKRTPLGRFGYSVMKPKTKKKLAAKRRNSQRKSGSNSYTKKQSR